MAKSSHDLRPGPLPVFISGEAAECGLACLAMVARYWGHEINLNGLRQLFPFSMAGSTLRQITSVASDLGLSSRAIRVEIGSLSQIQLPAIIHWDFDHFVVIAKVTASTVTVHDPSRGVQRFSIADFSKHFTGVALELEPAAKFVPVTARPTIRLSSLYIRVRGLWASGAHILTLSLVAQIIGFVSPLQLQVIIDQIIGAGDSALLFSVVLLFFSLGFIQILSDGLRAWTIQASIAAASFQITSNIVHHLLRLPIRFFEQRTIGDLLSRISSISAIQEIIASGVITALIDGLFALAAAALLFIYSPILAGVVMVTLAITVLVSLIAYPITRRRTEKALMSQAAERTFLMENLRAITTLRLVGLEPEREGGWKNLYARSMTAALGAKRWDIGSETIQKAVVLVQGAVVLAVGARMVVQGTGFTVGMLMVVLAYRQLLTDRCLSLVQQVGRLRLIGLHLDRIADITTAQPEAIDATMAVIDEPGRIVLEDVAFRYGTTDSLILRGVNLQIEPSAFVAIVGSSGSGKSTLLKLMLGVATPSYGAITVGGQTATASVWHAWRRATGVVTQDDRLLSGTLADNIACFDPDLDMARVERAARQAEIHAEIMEKPMKYLSLIGDMGSSLSAGQRQRVLIARALYRQPSVLILDEGTANLDQETESRIADSIAALPITRIVVAHRPALVDRADVVYRLEDGKLTLVRAAPLANSEASDGREPVVRARSV